MIWYVNLVKTKFSQLGKRKSFFFFFSVFFESFSPILKGPYKLGICSEVSMLKGQFHGSMHVQKMYIFIVPIFSCNEVT